ncbi:hypothetical protein NBRC110019_25020 [Neptunitalea chrysea]|uniref:Luciferase-like monooxygenase n=1 Tax=Neptunitalea chrysea TaxID=1647581 RepID=A0A9W6B601_9FLAO|nr:LLM class flavin-dependent oxidoreductase [Neptunitalea chrysea]GLB53461.1 hypothetical protein NBRC110019_25020 [Neptunitalea chrysea]
MSEFPHTQLPVSVLDLIPITQGATIPEALHNSVDLAQTTEQLGYKRFWLAEHHNMPNIASSATTVLMSHIASNTSHIRVGSGGIMLPNHSPLIVAEQFGTLAHLYQGRIDMGLGRAPGTDQVTAQAIRTDRMTAARHFPYEIEKIEKYFAADNEGSQVRAYIAEGAEVPMYILGSSTDSAYLAAAKGLPYVFASHFAPAQFMDAIEIYRKNFNASSGYLKEPYIIACVNVIAADTDAHAQYLSTTLKQVFMSIITGNLRRMPPPVENMNELWSVYHAEAASKMLTYSFIGSKETVKTEVQEFIKTTNINELMAVSHIYSHEERLYSYKLLAEIMC